MKKYFTGITQSVLVMMLLFVLSAAQSAAAAEGNISDTDKWAWSENAGWVNFRPTHGGVTVHDAYLSGYAWAENIGWVKLGSGTGPYDNTTGANWGVNHDNATGNLSGYAWSENAGWINFNPTHSQVIIDTTTLKFDGYAWAENVGWVHFQNDSPEYCVMQQPATTLATGTPSSDEAAVTKVEMYNGASWVTIFSGTAQLDVKAGGTFPGISDLSLPAGTYSQLRVTFNNSFLVAGTLSYGGQDYYTTAAAVSGQPNLASKPTTVAGSMVEFTFRIEDWGALNADVIQTYPITPVTVGPATDYQPTLRFTISDKLVLNGTDGAPSTYYFSLSAPTVSIVEP